MQKITPFLWFDDNAEEAAEFYTSLFPDAEIVETARLGEGGPGPAGQVLTIGLRLAGMELTFLNGGPGHPFTDAISLVIRCADQAEVDHYWDGLLAGGGTPVECGWITDRFGVSWQVTPTALIDLLTDPDPGRAGRAMAAMLTMVKIDVAELYAAADRE
ncbi:MAG: 3-demethylubiquinone-9 3-methyltransferase [Friedmanniella sp.]|nr:3-demethylubiquinone-9 3-methyltransferase [Friedmanniella sp.]